MRSSVVVAVSQLDLARLQFAATSIYHFLFVPVTIGLAFLVAILQTIWHRSGDDEYLRLTRFFGTLLLINVAVGVVTGLVQEFQFGMAWSSYSRFVGDVFGAPLAIEGLARLLPGVDLPRPLAVRLGAAAQGRPPGAIWLVGLGTVLSAAFIMAANSWMQHPVGYTIDPRHRPRPAHRHLGGAHQPVFLWGYAARAAGGSGHRRLAHAGRLRLASAAPRRRDTFASCAAWRSSCCVPAILLMLVGSELGAIETNLPAR